MVRHSGRHSVSLRTSHVRNRPMSRPRATSRPPLGDRLRGHNGNSRQRPHRLRLDLFESRVVIRRKKTERVRDDPSGVASLTCCDQARCFFLFVFCRPCSILHRSSRSRAPDSGARRERESPKTNDTASKTGRPRRATVVRFDFFPKIL